MDDACQKSEDRLAFKLVKKKLDVSIGGLMHCRQSSSACTQLLLFLLVCRCHPVNREPLPFVVKQRLETYIFV
jgi:hypothetical protein